MYNINCKLQVLLLVKLNAIDTVYTDVWCGTDIHIGIHVHIVIIISRKHISNYKPDNYIWIINIIIIYSCISSISCLTVQKNYIGSQFNTNAFTGTCIDLHKACYHHMHFRFRTKKLPSGISSAQLPYLISLFLLKNVSSRLPHFIHL